MKSNRTEIYDVFIRKVKNGYEIKTKNHNFNKFFNKGSDDTIQPQFSSRDSKEVKIPENISRDIYQHQLWDDYSKRCISCGRCNFACPTCSCFSIEAVRDENNLEEVSRQRIWSSCQIAGYSCLAGNHDFRTSPGERMRFKVLHKIKDHRQRHGRNMCTGCGRCDDICPEYISLSKIITSLSESKHIGVNGIKQ